MENSQFQSIAEQNDDTQQNAPSGRLATTKGCCNKRSLKRLETPAKSRVAHFRLHPSKGTFCLTSGIRALGNDCVREIIDIVRNFNNFNEDNDPYGEHDTLLRFA